jgi:hypothetical protein
MMRALAALLLLGCARAPLDATPEGALDQFLAACEDTARDPRASARAFALLAPTSRRALELRAQRATALMGRPVTPEQIFIPAFTPIRFEVSKTKSILSPDGTHAKVEVTGPDPTTQHASIPMEREGASWRVLIDIPNQPTP